MITIRFDSRPRHQKTTVFQWVFNRKSREVDRMKNKIGAGPPGEGDPVSAEGGALD